MGKLFRKRDLLLIGLALAGEVTGDMVRSGRRALRNPGLWAMVEPEYKRHNFMRTVGNLLATEHIERVLKNGKVYLRLTNEGRAELKRDFPLERLGKKWDGRWTVVIFDIPEEWRYARDKLRFDLGRLGFGGLQKSVWISPFPIADDIEEYLVNSGFAGYALVMVGPWRLGGDEKELAVKVFKLDKLNEQYQELLIKYIQGKKDLKARKKFASGYLQVASRDPFLPKQLLPPGWSGEEARELFVSMVRKPEIELNPEI